MQLAALPARRPAAPSTLKKRCCFFLCCRPWLRNRRVAPVHRSCALPRRRCWHCGVVRGFGGSGWLAARLPAWPTRAPLPSQSFLSCRSWTGCRCHSRTGRRPPPSWPASARSMRRPLPGRRRTRRWPASPGAWRFCRSSRTRSPGRHTRPVVTGRTVRCLDSPPRARPQRAGHERRRQQKPQRQRRQRPEGARRPALPWTPLPPGCSCSSAAAPLAWKRQPAARRKPRSGAPGRWSSRSGFTPQGRPRRGSGPCPHRDGAWPQASEWLRRPLRHQRGPGAASGPAPRPPALARPATPRLCPSSRRHGPARLQRRVSSRCPLRRSCAPGVRSCSTSSPGCGRDGLRRLRLPQRRPLLPDPFRVVWGPWAPGVRRAPMGAPHWLQRAGKAHAGPRGAARRRRGRQTQRPLAARRALGQPPEGGSAACAAPAACLSRPPGELARCTRQRGRRRRPPRRSGEGLPANPPPLRRGRTRPLLARARTRCPRRCLPARRARPQATQGARAWGGSRVATPSSWRPGAGEKPPRP